MILEEVEYDGINVINDGLDEKLSLKLHLNGYLDTMNANDITTYFTDTLSTQKGIKKLILDLSGLTYASSSGIGSFTSLLMNCKKQNIELELCCVHPKIKDVIDLLGFTAFFTIKD